MCGLVFWPPAKDSSYVSSRLSVERETRWLPATFRMGLRKKEIILPRYLFPSQHKTYKTILSPAWIRAGFLATVG